MPPHCPLRPALRIPRRRPRLQQVTCCSHLSKGKVAKNKNATLSEVSTGFQNSHRAFTETSPRLSALEARLAEVQNQGAEAPAKQKAQYAVKLKAHRDDSHVTRLLNARIASEIDDLRRSNCFLRKKAESLLSRQQTETPEYEIRSQKKCIATLRWLQSLSTNAGASHSVLENATEMKVLAELSDQDEVQVKAMNHEKRLHTFGLLQNPRRVNLTACCIRCLLPSGIYQRSRF